MIRNYNLQKDVYDGRDLIVKYPMYFKCDTCHTLAHDYYYKNSIDNKIICLECLRIKMKK